MVFPPGYNKEFDPLQQDVFNPLFLLTHKLEDLKAFYPFVDSGQVPQLFTFAEALKPSYSTLVNLSLVTMGVGMPFVAFPPNLKCFAASGTHRRNIGNLKNSKDVFRGKREVLPQFCEGLEVLELNERSYFWSEM